MTNLCTIGPVSITDANLYDGQTFNYSNSATKTVASGSSITTRGQYGEEFGFDIICTNSEALQLRGVVEMGEVIWMDTSNELTDNNFLQHKGWVVLTSLETELINPNMVQMSINYVKISDHENEYLTMDYSRGIYDGVNLVPSYTIATTTYQLQEDGSDATTNWSTIREYPTAATTSWASDGSEFDLSVAASPDGTNANGWVICDTMEFTPPFTFETVLDRNSLPGAGAYPASLGIMFSPTSFASGNPDFVNKSAGDTFEFQWNCSTGSTNAHIAYVGSKGQVAWKLTGLNLGTTFAECGLRMEFESNGNVRVSTDLDTTGTWSQVFYGPSGLVNYKNGLKLYAMVKNRDSTAFVGSFQYMHVTTTNADTFPNVVHMPYNSTLVTAATGHRHGEDGDIYYYTNPTNERRFTIAKADYYKGSVKLFSTNNSANASRQVFSTGQKLTPTTTVLKNEFTRLTFTATGFTVAAWDSGAWHDVNTIVTGTINLIRPLFINSERIVMQVNGIKLTMLRSSPVVTMEHPNDAVTYTLRDRYALASGTISGPGAGTDIAMTANTDYYCPIYDNAAATYQLLICKKDPTTIKSDSLPAGLTGVGWMLSGATGVDAGGSLAQQWYRQTRTGISLKQII